MIIIEKKNVNDIEKEIDFGDIIETTGGTYFVSCDGYGQFFFINLSDNGFIRSLGSNDIYKVSAHGLKFKVGDYLFPMTSVEIVAIHRREDVNITVELP